MHKAGTEKTEEPGARAFALFMCALVCSVVIYLLLFGYVFHKPLTDGELFAELARKRQIARSMPSPKLVIFAGSNGRYSHSCKKISADLHVACANFGTQAGTGIDFLFQQMEPELKSGDVVYMPLEYEDYTSARSDRLHGQEAAGLFYLDKSELWRLGAARFFYGAFAFDLKYIFSAIAEMGLEARHFQRRVGVSTLNAVGDETSNTLENAKGYHDYVKSMSAISVNGAALAAPSDGKAQLSSFLAWARDHGVTVVGGLPVTFLDTQISDSEIASIASIYRENGSYFLLLENRSLYPRQDFFDGAYHLTQPWQAAHSDLVATHLACMPSVRHALRLKPASDCRF